MPVVAYQSFNANTAKDHNIESTSFQQHTMGANKNAVANEQNVLVLPKLPDEAQNVLDPVHGPAQLLPVRPLCPLEKAAKSGSVSDKKSGGKRKRGDDDEEALTSAKKTRLSEARLAQGSHLQTVFQRVYRQFGATPDLLVIGELDVSHEEYKSIVDDARVRVTAHPNPMACQSFSSFSDTRLASQAELKHTGVGYVVYSVGRATIAFVHVPNELAGNKEKTQIFYEDMVREIRGSSGKCINMIIGDTNQPAFSHTLGCLNASTAFKVCEFQSAFANKAVLVDTYSTGPNAINTHMAVKGTNSVATKMFDIAVYCTKCIKVEEAVHFSQSGTSTTVTDHAGIAVKFTVK